MNLRDNLDLEEAHSDADIWLALEKTKLKALVEGLPGKLDYMVTSDGGSFSRGERQLLALARCLLRNRNLVCLDEVSAPLSLCSRPALTPILRHRPRSMWKQTQ